MWDVSDQNPKAVDSLPSLYLCFCFSKGLLIKVL